MRSIPVKPKLSTPYGRKSLLQANLSQLPKLPGDIHSAICMNRRFKCPITSLHRLVAACGPELLKVYLRNSFS